MKRALSRVWLLAVLGLACPQRRATTTAQCTTSTDCSSELTCVTGFCREQCTRDSDCTGGTVCVQSPRSSAHVCYSPTQERAAPLCRLNSDCSQSSGVTLCNQGLCTPECNADLDCRSVTGAVCDRPTHSCLLPAVDSGVAPMEDASALDTGCPPGGCGVPCNETVDCFDLGETATCNTDTHVCRMGAPADGGSTQDAAEDAATDAPKVD